MSIGNLGNSKSHERGTLKLALYVRGLDAGAKQAASRRLQHVFEMVMPEFRIMAEFQDGRHGEVNAPTPGLDNLRSQLSEFDAVLFDANAPYAQWGSSWTDWQIALDSWNTLRNEFLANDVALLVEGGGRFGDGIIWNESAKAIFRDAAYFADEL